MRRLAVCLVACLPLLVGCAQQPVVSQTDPSRPATAQPPPPPPKPAAPAAAPTAQTRIPAKRGETCLAYFKGCIDWCTTNMAGSESCLNYCKEQFTTCQGNGEWSMDNNTKVIFGMPPK